MHYLHHLVLVSAHKITRLLLDEIYPPREVLSLTNQIVTIEVIRKRAILKNVIDETKASRFHSKTHKGM